MGKKLVLRERQEKAVTFAFERDGAIMSFKPGGGKSVVTLTTFLELREEGVVNRLLIIAPLSICHVQWPSEIRQWSNFDNLTFGVIHGTEKQKQKVWDSKPDITILNPAGVEWLVKKPEYRMKKDPDFPDMLVVDESTEFKSGTSKRFRALKKMLPRVNHAMCLTGNILSEKYLDLFGQVYVVDRGKALGRFVTGFRKQYFDEHKYVPGVFDIKEGAAEEITRKISHLIFHSDNSDIEMPELDMIERPVKIPQEAMEQYGKMMAKYIVEIKGTTIKGANQAVTFNKLRQMLSGWVFDNKKNLVEVHTAKLDAIRGLAAELSGRPLLIGYDYKHEGKALSEALSAPYIGGDTSPKKRIEYIEQWNRGELPILIGHPSSMGHGLNLQYGGCNVAWFTVPWSFEKYDQFNRRVYRAGQKNKVTVYHLQAYLPPGLMSLDEYVMMRMDDKQDGQEQFYEWLGEG